MLIKQKVDKIFFYFQFSTLQKPNFNKGEDFKLTGKTDKQIDKTNILVTNTTFGRKNNIKCASKMFARGCKAVGIPHG